MEPVCALWKNRKSVKFYRRKVAFDRFRDIYLKLTDYCYHSFSELKSSKPEADLYIAGSDQIWNSLYDNGRDSAFYCAFEDNNRKCISYAASFGSDFVHPDFLDFVKKRTCSF